MRYFLLFILLGVLFTGCLKRDILKDDLTNANFRETDFFTTGDFESELTFTVDQVELTQVITSTGDTLCRPTITLHLNDDYASRLNINWKDEIRIVLGGDHLQDKLVYTLSPGYTHPLLYKHELKNCGFSGFISFDYRLELLDPNTTRVSVVVEKTMDVQIP